MGDVIADRVAFARTVLGIEPFEHQAEALRSVAPIVAGVGGRRSGKTEAAKVAMAHSMMVHAGSRALVVAPNVDAVRRLVEEFGAMLRGSELAAGAVVDAQALRVELRNGSVLQGMPPTPGQVRGFGRDVFFVLVDEAGHCPPGLWRDLRYVLLDHRAEGAQAWLVGSPWGSPEHWYRQEWRRGQDGDPDVFAFQWSTSQNRLLPEEFIARERGRMNGIEARAELDGEWVEDGLQFFSHALVESCTADIEIPRLAELQGPARGILSFDTGVTYDPCALMAIYRLPVRGLNGDDGVPRFLALPYSWPAGALLNDVVEDVLRSPAAAHARYVATETNGVGAMPSQELLRRWPKTRGRRVTSLAAATTNARKLAAYSTIRWLSERGQIVWPRDPDLLRQLAGLRLDFTGQGAARIQAEDAAVHDDLADALALGTLPFAHAGRIKTQLSVLADAGPRAWPEASVQALDVPIVETGAGLRVWQRPALQSVSGSEVTLPVIEPAESPAERIVVGVRDRVMAAMRENNERQEAKNG